MSGLSSEQTQFARALAHPNKRTRDSTMAALREYLSSQQSIEQVELLKLWKGLFYCMWLADKAPVQKELADAISDLLHVFRSEQLALDYTRAFFATIVREWSGIDYLRVDKYYTFIRSFVRHVLVLLKEHGFRRQLVETLNAALKEEVLTKMPNGVRLHVADLYLEELCSAAGADVSAGAFFQLMEPFVHAATKTDDAVFQGRVLRGVFRQFLNVAADAAHDTEGDAQEEQSTPRFANVTLQQMQAKVFEMAADPETKSKFRADLYALHRDYQQATGQKNVDPSVIPANDAVDEPKSAAKRKRAANGDAKAAETKKPAAAKAAAKATKVAAAAAGIADAASSDASDATTGNQKKRKKGATVTEETKQEVSAAQEEADAKPRKTKKAAAAAADAASEAVENGTATPAKAGNAAKRARKEDAAANGTAGKSAAQTPRSESKQTEGKQAEADGASAAPASFIASKKFAGAKRGYVFKRDSKGVGYYLDKKQAGKPAKKKRVSFGSLEQKDYRSSVQGLKKAVVNTSSTPTKSLLKKPQSSTPAAAKSAARKKAKDYF